MTPARNNVRATRHFGIPARKSSPSAPLQPFPREKNSPGTPLQQFPREKVRPATASPWPNREKTRPTRPRQRLSPGHESARAKEFAQHPLQPFPREKTRPATAQSWPNREKLSQRAQKHQNLANFPEQGELFRVSQTNSPRRANFFAQIQHSTCNSGTPLARHTQQSTHTLVIERKPLVVHRLSFPLVVIHRLTRKA